MSLFKFTYTTPFPEKSKARLGRLETPHGSVDTPAFIFCATKAAMKGLTCAQMRHSKTQFILSNTYHLMLQPGPEVVAKAGGLHKFMGWDGPLLTDSGGFQIFSLGHGSVACEIKGNRQTHRPKTLLKITEEGALFKSYINGSMHLLTPEKSMDIQRLLGPDFAVVLDECTPFHVDKKYTEKSMNLSHRWADRCLSAFQKTDTGRQKLYGIVQGGIYEDLREEGCSFVNSRDFFGQAIGGSLGATKEQMYDVVALTMSKLSPHRPTHLLGIGNVRDIFNGVQHGIDTFDCVHPTRLARHGGALVKAPFQDKPGREHINLRNRRYEMDHTPIEPDCLCQTCQTVGKGYLHHLLKAQELVAFTLISIHNVYYMNTLLEKIRHAIQLGTLEAEKKNWILETSP